MKTGKPTRLSEKLNAQLDDIRQEHIASISSLFKNFRIDLKNIVGAAQHTIASDTRRFQTETASMFETRLRSIRLWLTISPWLIAAMVLTGIALMMAASFFWTVRLTRSELTEMGLTRIERPEGTWLILDPSKTRLTACTMGGRPVTCIRIEEDQMTQLTALERDLLACVERLVTASVAPGKELARFEAQLRKMNSAQAAELTDCLNLLVNSQIASMRALRGLLCEEASYSALDAQLKKSWDLAKSAEQRLNQS